MIDDSIRTSESLEERFARLEQELADLRRDAAESQTRHGQLLARLRSIVFHLAPDGSITYINPAAYPLTGYLSDELIGTKWFDMCRPTSYARDHDMLSLVRSGGMTDLECVVTSRDGARRLLEVTATAQYGPDGEIRSIMGYAADPSDRRRQDIELDAAHGLLKSVFASLQTAVLVVARDTRITVTCNPAVQEVLGYAPTDLIGRTTEILYPDFTGFKETGRRIYSGLATEGRFDVECALRHKDGRRLTCEVTVTSLPSDSLWHGTIVCSIRDITDHRLAERRQALTSQIMSILNGPIDAKDIIQEIAVLLRDYAGTEAVGLRLREGDDYPYYRSCGLPKQFELMERHLCRRDDSGRALRDERGEPELECLCGRVIRGNTDRSAPFVSGGGSLWTNRLSDTLPMLKAEYGDTLRGKCPAQGYQSMALIPLRTGGESMGLIQFLDTRPDRFSIDTIHLLEDLSKSIGIALKRRMSERATRESEDRFHRAILGAPFPMMLHADDGEVILISRSWTEITGYSREQIATIAEWTGRAHGEDACLVRRVIDRAYGMPESGAYSIRTSDGRSRLWEFSSMPLGVMPDGRRLALSAAVDVTETKDAEERLRQSEEMYRTMIEHSNDFIWTMDTEGRVTFANRHIDAVSAFGADALIGVRYESLVVPEDLQTVKDAHARLLDGEPQHVDAHIRVPDGGARLVSTNSAPIWRDGRVVGTVHFGRDTTEQHESEEALRRSEEQFRTLFETMVQGVIYYSADGTITAANPAAEGILGLSLDQISGQMPADPRWWTIHEDGSPFPRETHPSMEALRSGMDVRNVVMGICRPNQEATRWININAIPQFRSGEEQPYQVYTTIEDITPSKQAEMEIKRQAARAESLARMAASLNVELDLDSVVHTVCRMASRALQAPACVTLHDERRKTFRVVAGSDDLPSGYLEGIRPVPESICDSERLVIGDVILVPDVRELPSHPNEQLQAQYGTRTIACAGLARGRQLVGTLTVYSFGSIREFTEDELELLRGLAHQAAQAITNARLFEEANRRLGFLQALGDIDRAISGSLDLALTLDICLNRVMAQLKVHAATVLLLDPHLQVLEFAKGKGFRNRSIEGISLRLGEGYAGHAAMTREMVSVLDMRATPSPTGKSSLLDREGFVSCNAVPLIGKGQVQGVLEVFHRTPFEPDDEWLDFLRAIASQAAIAIDNARLFEAQQMAHSEMIIAYDTTLEGWSRALDLRDKETEGHSVRVTEMTVRLAEVMGAGKADMVHIRRGALLHDIGKVGIPDSILSKPGPLIEEEWQTMRKHPDYALELLSTIPFLKQALDIPYCHHEKWDGSGYPRGLEGEQIPVAARIFTVVDVWDALASDRPYRKAWPKEDVLRYIQEHSGRHFDPSVVAAFLRLIERSRD